MIARETVEWAVAEAARIEATRGAAEGEALRAALVGEGDRSARAQAAYDAVVAAQRDRWEAVGVDAGAQDVLNTSLPCPPSDDDYVRGALVGLLAARREAAEEYRGAVAEAAGISNDSLSAAKTADARSDG